MHTLDLLGLENGIGLLLGPKLNPNQYHTVKHGTLICALWRHQIETFSALLVLCAGNSPVTGESPHICQWRGALMFSFFYAWTNGWVNSRDVGDLRRHRAHYDVNVMEAQSQSASHCKTWDAYLRFVTNHTDYMYLCKCVLKAMLNRHSIFDMHK